ncbi:ATP-binding protein [Streptomyces scopuliridis]
MIQDDGGPGSGLLRSRLIQARDQSFVGRENELTSFRSAVADNGPPVLYVHGPGGIGKSTLLRRYAHEARAAGRMVVGVDGHTVSPTPEDFAHAAGEALRRPDAVLLIDTFEVCQGLEGWLWERFLPELPLGAVAVIAGRVAPGTRWITDSGWRDHLTVIALRNLPPGDATAYLRAYGVPARTHGELLSFTGGNPLALSLAAAVAAQGDGGEKQWTADQDVIATLLPQLVGEVPTSMHRTALEVCAHAYLTTGDPDAGHGR